MNVEQKIRVEGGKTVSVWFAEKATVGNGISLARDSDPDLILEVHEEVAEHAGVDRRYHARARSGAMRGSSLCLFVCQQ